MPARQEKIRELLQTASCGSVDDIQHLYKETIAKFIESSLKAELEDALGYSQYDYKDKDIDSKLLTTVCMKIIRPPPYCHTDSRHIHRVYNLLACISCIRTKPLPWCYADTTAGALPE